MHRGALEDLEQRLLHAFSGDVARHGGVVPTLARDLVDLVDIDNAAARSVHIAVGRLNEPTQHRFHVVAHIASLGERRGVDDDKRHLHGLGQRLRQIGLADTGRTEQQDVGFGHLHIFERVNDPACLPGE